MKRIWIGLLGIPLLLGACGGGDEQPSASDNAADAVSPTTDASAQAATPPAGGGSNLLAKASPLDVAGAKDFAAIPRYPDSWIVKASALRETYSACGRSWSKYDIHYQSAEPDNARILDYLIEKLTSLGWAGENERNESGSIATAYLTKDKLACVPAGTAYLRAVSLVARSAVDETIVVTLTVPSDCDPFVE